MSASDVVPIQLHPPMAQNLITPISFKNEEVAKVDPLVFGQLSAKFRREMYDESSRGRCAKDPVVIESNVERETVEKFVEACNGAEIKVERHRLHDLFRLAEEWEVMDMIQALRTDGYFADVLVRLFLKRREIHVATMDLEKELHDQFISICYTKVFQENLKQIGLNVIYKVFSSFGDCDLVRNHLSEVFPFMQKCVDEFGPCASVLFAGIDVSQLNDDELNWMKDSPNFDHSYICNSYFQTIMKLRRALKAKEAQCESQSIDLAITIDLHKASMKLHEMKDTLQEHLRKLEVAPQT